MYSYPETAVNTVTIETTDTTVTIETTDTTITTVTTVSTDTTIASVTTDTIQKPFLIYNSIALNAMDLTYQLLLLPGN
jgi:hypothetical protein